MHRILNHRHSILFYLVIIGSCFIFPESVLAQDDEALVPFIENGLWGYMNAEQEVVVEPQFSEAGPFYNGYAQIGKNHLIDKTGKKYKCDLGRKKISRYSTFNILKSKNPNSVLKDSIELGEHYAPDVIIGKYHFKARRIPVDSIKIYNGRAVLSSNRHHVDYRYYCISDTSIKFSFNRHVKTCNTPNGTFHILDKIAGDYTSRQVNYYKYTSRIGGNTIVNENLDTIKTSGIKIVNGAIRREHNTISGTDDYYYLSNNKEVKYYDWNHELINIVSKSEGGYFNWTFMGEGRYLYRNSSGNFTSVYDCLADTFLFSGNNRRYISPKMSTAPTQSSFSHYYGYGHWLRDKGNAYMLTGTNFDQNHSIPLNRDMSYIENKNLLLINTVPYYELIDMDGNLKFRFNSERMNFYTINEQHYCIDKNGIKIEVAGKSTKRKLKNYIFSNDPDGNKTFIQNNQGELLSTINSNFYPYTTKEDSIFIGYGHAYSLRTKNAYLKKPRYKNLDTKAFEKSILTIRDSLSRISFDGYNISWDYTPIDREDLVLLNEAYYLANRHSDKCGNIYWEGFITGNIKVLLDDLYRPIAFYQFRYGELSNEIDWNLHMACGISDDYLSRPMNYFSLLNSIESEYIDTLTLFRKLKYYKKNRMEDLTTESLKEYMGDSLYNTLYKKYEILAAVDRNNQNDFVELEHTPFEYGEKKRADYKTVLDYLTVKKKSEPLFLLQNSSTKLLYVYTSRGDINEIKTQDIIDHSFPVKDMNTLNMEILSSNLIVFSENGLKGVMNSQTQEVVIPAKYSSIALRNNFIHAKVPAKHAYILPDQSIWWAEEGFRLNLED